MHLFKLFQTASIYADVNRDLKVQEAFSDI